MSARAYIALRRSVRSFVIGRPWLDRSLGTVLRRLESRVAGPTWWAPEGAGKVECNGSVLFYRPEDMGVVSTILLNGLYEPETSRGIEDLLQPGASFVDVGAHIGYFTLLAARAVGPEGHVYAFEPAAATCEMLRKNVAANDFGERVTIVHRAVAQERNRVHLRLDAAHSVSAHVDDADNEVGASEEVEAVSLDEFFAELGWPGVQLVKVDVEGSEIGVIRGMRELVARNPGLNLIFEYHDANLARSGVTPEELFDTLRSCGFARFHVMWRDGGQLQIPQQLPELVTLGKRANVNILAEQARSR